jgi:hypothetical protein
VTTKDDFDEDVDPIAAVVDTNVLLDIFSGHDLIEAYDAVAVTKSEHPETGVSSSARAMECSSPSTCTSIG